MSTVDRQAQKVAKELQTQPVQPIATVTTSGPCVFAIWAQREALNDASPEIPESAKNGDWYLVYVGAAPFSETLAATARLDRVIKNHVRGSLASSSLRVNLAALLREKLDLKPALHDKYAKLVDERPLTRWISTNCGVTIVPTDKAWELEGPVIRILRPPLNIRKGSHSFLSEVDKARRQLFLDCGITRVSKPARILNE